MYRSVIFPVGLYGCVNVVAHIDGERSLRVFMKRVLRRIFGPKRDQYCSGDQIGKNEMGGHVACIGRGEAYTGFSWGNLRERDLGRSRCRWEDRLTMGLLEVECGGMDWVDLAQDSDR